MAPTRVAWALGHEAGGEEPTDGVRRLPNNQDLRTTYSSSNCARVIGAMASQLVGVNPSSWGTQSSCLGPVRSSADSRLHGAGNADSSDAREKGDPGDAVSCGPLALSEAAWEEASDAGAARASSGGVGGPTGGGAAPGPPDPTPRAFGA